MFARTGGWTRTSTLSPRKRSSSWKKQVLFAAPTGLGHLVPKKDGSWCPFGDYCHLNAITILDRYPIPNIGGQAPLEERRHQADMTQVYKILTEKDMVKSDTWFLPVNNEGRSTRSTADPLNLRIQPARLEVRRNFFTNRVVEDWNKIPSSLKSAKTVKSFKNGYSHLRATMVENA